MSLESISATFDVVAQDLVDEVAASIERREQAEADEIVAEPN